MSSSVFRVPNDATLTAALRSALNDGGQKGLSIVGRKPSMTESTFAGEIVTCRLGDGRPLKIYCKYEAGHRHQARDHRRGLAYEAAVYSRLLQSLTTTAPAFLGSFHDPASGDTWLFLEFLAGCTPVHCLEDVGPGLARAAGWAARFHLLNERCVAENCPAFLVRFDAGCYRRWAHRAAFVVQQLGCKSWLAGAVRACEKMGDLLVAQPQTIIHGDFAYDNLLIRPSGDLSPVDWESAAVGVGEMDLGFLTWGWGEEISRLCELEYQRVRWPAGAPSEFTKVLSAARLLMLIRHLGDYPESTCDAEATEFLGEIQANAQGLGLI